MIRYAKGPPPPRLTALAATPGATWGSLGADDRGQIREALIRDQGALCAYCQQRISPEDDSATGRSRMKIEHWASRATSTELHFTWSNLLGVCRGGTHDKPASRRDHGLHCDASRGDRKLFLHPIEGRGPDPREHLRYNKGGEVQAAKKDTRIDDDIGALNLNAPRLRRAREAVLEALWQRLERYGFASGELRRIANIHKIAAGTPAPPHAELVRYHVLKKLRSKGEAE